MKPTLLIFIRFTWSNIFYSLFEEVNNRRIPLITRWLNLFGYKYGRTNLTFQNSKEFARHLALSVKGTITESDKIILVFKNLGLRFKRRKQKDEGLEKHRQIFIEALTRAKVPLTGIIDSSAFPFNGCKTWKKRRKKRKYLDKEIDH